MILRRRMTRRVPSGPIRTRSSSQPPCSARSTRSLVTTLRGYSFEKDTFSNSHSTPRAGGRRVARLIAKVPSIGRHVVEGGIDLVRQAQLLDAERGLELRGGAGAEDRRGDAGAVADPGERDLERGPPEPVGGTGHRLDDAGRAVV